jgi:hypothetical protein
MLPINFVICHIANFKSHLGRNKPERFMWRWGWKECRSSQSMDESVLNGKRPVKSLGKHSFDSSFGAKIETLKHFKRSDKTCGIAVSR